MARYGLNEELVFTRHKKIIEKGKDRDAMTGIKTYYELTKRDGESEGNITLNLNF